ncbi:hypothetical protein G6F68_021416 [Rhizopus microsporus]|nr:hypothetical protein G6F68_021416 [Rhizopus microsporus]
MRGIAQQRPAPPRPARQRVTGHQRELVDRLRAGDDGGDVDPVPTPIRKAVRKRGLVHLPVPIGCGQLRARHRQFGDPVDQ